ncbi:alpha/beta hydrolase [Kribbella sp. NPDC051770]|uniref:alpha/beta hydrolase family protein n=1 Tax=Kribbella sp. NPDC051770 TaxID=3155413 RepID=UPI00342B2FBC
MRKVLLAATSLILLLNSMPQATAAPPAVGTATYDLGATAYTLPGTDLKAELTAVVHYPKKLSGKYPVVLMSHGLWDTCIDRKAGQLVSDWPCPAGTEVMPSYRGYDYLGDVLAAQGMIVISIGANGTIPQFGEEQDAGRAALINKHLAMWQKLATTGGGPLAGKVRDHGKVVDFRGHADLMNVGLLGHSRGGRGTLFQAADIHQKDWPAGVRVKAVVPLAPAEPYSPDDDPDGESYDPYRITNIPVAGLIGSCDGAVQGQVYNYLQAHNKAPLFQYFIPGANHDFFNSQWSPGSGQIGAYDDATPAGPGRCKSSTGSSDKQLTETQQREVATTYISAFYRHYLLGDQRMNPVTISKDLPVGHP